MRQQHNTRLMKRPVGAALIANRKHSHNNKPTQQAAKMVRPKTTKPHDNSATGTTEYIQDRAVQRLGDCWRQMNLTYF